MGLTAVMVVVAERWRGGRTAWRSGKHNHSSLHKHSERREGWNLGLSGSSSFVRTVGLVVKASTTRAKTPGSTPAFAAGIYVVRATPVT